MVKRKTESSKGGRNRPKEWDLRLYVAGRTPLSLRAFQNITRVCEEYLAGDCSIEVIDVSETPRLAAEDQIVALPALVLKTAARPFRKMMVGDLSNTEKLLARLESLSGLEHKSSLRPH